MYPKGFTLLALLSLGVGITGCVQKVPPAPTAAAGGAGMQVVQAPVETPVDPKTNNGRIVPDPAAAPESGTAVPAAAPGVAPAAPAADEYRDHGGTKASPVVTGETGDKAALAQKVSRVEAQYAKKPNDPMLKKQLADALYAQGQQIMYDDTIMPRMKYGPALKLFNRALALDPAHQGAAKNKQIIEQIYESMGRPVPQ